jgi:pilus assembly protein CpaB
MSRHFGGGNQMRQSDKARIVLLVGAFAVLLFSSLAFLFMYSGSSKATTTTVVVEKEAEIKMADVLVPIEAIEAGQALEPVMFRKESRPQVGLSSRVVKDFEEIKGHYSRSLIVAEQPLHRDYITNIRPTNALTVKIPEGYRAVTISVDAKSSVEGWARPGARVDVIWASRIRDQPAVTEIVQNAQVLSAERQTDTNTKSGGLVPSTVTLLVTAKDAAKIQLAQTTGSLSLNLRGDTDGGKGSEGGVVTLADLTGTAAKSNETARSQNTLKMRGKNGKMEEWEFRDGRLVPVEPSRD